MIVTRHQLEEIEDQQLATWGFRSRLSRGREVKEDEPSHRTVFQRDRDRILHTTAFRRLEYKTQVFVYHEGDYYRTRLTHTLEVAQIGRSIARALGANEDLVEAISLAHDLGHPPFGHAGEKALSQLMASHDGFDHNQQSLRIVTLLERRYTEFPGLNLTWEVREGIVKHETEYDVAHASGYEPEKRAFLEAQISNAADEIAYSAHDLDDGLRSGLLDPLQLSGLALWELLREGIGWHADELDDLTRHRLIRRLIGIEINDLLQTTIRVLSDNAITTPDDIRCQPQHVARFSQDLDAMNRELKAFLFLNMYRHPHVLNMQTESERILKELFDAYLSDSHLLPPDVQHRLHDSNRPTVVCDYIAGMTDRFALQEMDRLTKTSESM